MRYHIYTYPQTETKEKINNNIIMEQEDSTFMKTIKAWNGILIACTSAFICFIITLVIHADMSDNASCTGAITTLTEGQSTGIKFVIFCTATMSMVGSSFIIFSYYAFSVTSGNEDFFSTADVLLRPKICICASLFAGCTKNTSSTYHTLTLVAFFTF